MVTRHRGRAIALVLLGLWLASLVIPAGASAQVGGAGAGFLPAQVCDDPLFGDC